MGLLAFNALTWVIRYGMSTDNSYIEVEGYLAQTLPPGTAVIGRDLLDLYMLPRNDTYTYAYLNLTSRPIDPAAVVETKAPYVILNEQSLLQHYGGANPTYYEWVYRYGMPVFNFEGRLWETSVYYIDHSKDVGAIGVDSLAVGKPAAGIVGGGPRDRTMPNSPSTQRSPRAGHRKNRPSDEEWIYVDLGQSTEIGRIEVVWETAFARGYRLQVSDNARDWSTILRDRRG